MKKTNSILTLLLTLSLSAFSQTNDVATLSKGRYIEVFENDTLQRIGSVMFNTVSNKIEYFIEESDSVVKQSTESSRWMSMDPLAHKYPNMSPYVFCSDNPIYYIDPDGRENIPALLWALKNMANKTIPSTYSDPYFAGSDSRWTYIIGTVPDRTVCYESCFMAYMNSGADVIPTLKTGFTNKNNAFKGRSTETGGMNWFKAGTGADRSFVTDIEKGELGDIVFMGEPSDMQGHAVLLASPVTIGNVEVDGKTIETATFYSLSTSSDSESDHYGGREFTFQKQSDGTWKQQGGAGYTFNGFGQMKNVNTTDEQKQEATKLVEEVKTR